MTNYPLIITQPVTNGRGKRRRFFSKAFLFALSFIFLCPSLSIAQDQTNSTASKSRVTKADILKKQRQRRSVRKSTPKKAPGKTTTAKKRPGKKKFKKRVKSQQLAQNPSKRGSATIESFRKNVRIKKAGSENWSKTSKRAKLSGNDKIKTGRRSMARVKMEDGSKILLLQNSQAELEELSSVKKTIKLLRGRIRAIVRKLKQARTFKIKTPIGVASVRGTEFEVEYQEDQKEMTVEVLKGSVAVSKLGDLAEEIILNPGEKIRFGLDGELGDPIQTGAIPIYRAEVRNEMVISSVKNSIVSQAAEESRSADYQVGKTIIDAEGKLVRIESYIMRPTPTQFKLVTLNERANRFDYFYYLGTFNATLPGDLSIALGQLGGTLNSQASYWLKSYEQYSSNTVDNITEIASGGHLVSVERLSNGNYLLTDVETPSNSEVVEAAALQSDGTYKVFNPLKGTFSLVTAANKDDAIQIAVRDTDGNYRNMTTGDTFYKGQYNDIGLTINGVAKTSYAQATTADSLYLAQMTATNAPITTISEFPSGSDRVHNKLSLYYSDGTKLVYNNYIIDDEGNTALSSSFSGLSNSADYQNELLKWNYQQNATSDEMNGRSIKLVFPSEIATQSGLIQ